MFIKESFVVAVGLLVIVQGLSEYSYDGDDFEQVLAESNQKFSDLVSVQVQSAFGKDLRSLPVSAFREVLPGATIRDASIPIQVEKVVIDDIASPRIEKVVPNLKEGSLRLKAYIDFVSFTMFWRLDGSDESFPLTVKLYKMSAKGRAGLFVEKGSAIARNLDLKYSFPSMEYSVGPEASAVFEENEQAFKNAIHQYVEMYMTEVIDGMILERLEYALSEISFTEVFDYNGLTKYRSHLQGRTQSANDLADFLLQILKTYLTQQGLSKLDLPNLDQWFPSKIGKGHFVASGGHVRDPTSIYRTGDFSIDGDFEKDTFTLHGSIGFRTLVAKYDYYKVDVGIFHPHGWLEVTVGHNAVKFSITGKLIDGKVIKVNDFGFKITNLDNMKAKATGLSFLLNWLLNIIATNIVNGMKGDLIHYIEAGGQDAISKLLDSMNYEIPLN